MSFHQTLRRFTFRWRLGLLAAGLLAALALALVVCLAFGWFDYLAPFSDQARPTAAGAMVSLGAFLFLWAFVPMLMLRAREAAALADEHTGARRPVTTAFELTASSEAPASPSPLRDFLVIRSLDEGAHAVQGLAFSASIPWQILKSRIWQVTLVLAVIGGLCLANRRAVDTIAMRLAFPHRDIPPYSPLEFDVSPQQPKVVYGSDADLEVAIKGGAVDQGVMLLTRMDADAAPAQTGAFAMGGGRYGQKLQRVVEPAQIAFAVGKARSRWIQVDVMRQPRFESATITVTPPAYTRLPPKEFVLGTADLAALAGSWVEARITSNRPLSGAVATLTPPRSLSREKADSVSVTTHGERELTLRWKVKGPALVRIDLKDITGASSAQPVELQQKLLPDEPPEVTLNSPAGVVLATPESEVPVDVEVQDDFGIARVDLVRKLAGFRDRGRMLAEDAVDRTFTASEKLDLAKLGVAPGQTLEFYAEAHDHNPTLMGIGSSSVGRIQVISHQEYADLIRARTQMREFQERFGALHQSVEAVKEALEKAAKGDPQGAEEARQAMEKTRQLAEAMSKDFVAFDAEKKIAAEASKVAEQMAGLEQRLAQAGPAGAQAEAQKQLAEIGESAKATKQLAEEGQDLAALGQVLEMAAEFRAMHAAQRKLTKGLEELSEEIMAGDMRNAAKLDGLAQQQKQVLEHWKAWDKELRAAADALPGKFSQFKKEALDFADKADAAGIQKDMERALAQAKKVSTPDTFVNSQMALAGMESLLAGESNMCKACQSNEPHFQMKMDGVGQSMADTLAQMLSGMCKRHGFGNKPGNPGLGQGAAMGGGSEESGNAMEGDTLLQAPVYGPGRMIFSSGQLTGETSGGKGTAAQASVRPDAQAKIEAKTTRTEARRQISLRDVPERYRDAVRRFYGEEAVKETTTIKNP